MSDVFWFWYFLIGAIPALFLFFMFIIAWVATRAILSENLNNNSSLVEIAAATELRSRLWTIPAWGLIHFFIWPISLPFGYIMLKIRKRRNNVS